MLFENLSYPDEVMGDVRAATYEAAVSLTGETDPVISPADVPIEAGVNTIVYAWGSAADGDLALAVQTVDTVTTETAPVGVQAGSQGLADEGSGANVAIAVALIAALGLAGFAVSVAVARRNR